RITSGGTRWTRVVQFPRGRAAERFLTTENTEQHGKEIRMCFHFCVLPCFPWLLPSLTLPTKVPSDSLGRIGSLKRTSDKSLFPMALRSCGHRITHQLRPINMNGRSILAVTSQFIILSYRLWRLPQFCMRLKDVEQADPSAHHADLSVGAPVQAVGQPLDERFGTFHLAGALDS